jgi:hypothetical protein
MWKSRQTQTDEAATCPATPLAGRSNVTAHGRLWLMTFDLLNGSQFAHARPIEWVVSPALLRISLKIASIIFAVSTISRYGMGTGSPSAIEL